MLIEGRVEMSALQWKYKDEEVDFVIVGAGAAGGVLAKRLAEAKMGVVVIEAGPTRDPQHDFASDELSMQCLAWNDSRIVTGKNPLTMGHNNSGRGVGGGTVHFTGVFLRFHESDFRTKSEDGVGEDWPITYKDLEPYYDKIEKEIAVSGPKYFPWGSFNGPYPYPERDPLSPNTYMFMKGANRLGVDVCVAPLAILSAPFEGRPPCINRGFCNQGCMPNAKFSTLIHHIPKAIEAGAIVLDNSTVTEVISNQSGKVTGVRFINEGKEYIQKAKVVILSAFAVETPRLLLHSATPQHPDGLANSSGWVGKGLMPHSSHDVYGKFDEEIRLYKGTPVLATTQDFYTTNIDRGFARGYSIHAHGARPLGMAGELATRAGLWGKQLRNAMLDYNYYGRLTLVGEVLPQYENGVSLADEKDSYGVPRAKITFSYGDNDLQLIDHAVQMMGNIIEAANGKVKYVTPDTAHLMGGCRMGTDPTSSVVNSYCRSHDIDNLFICDASVFVTSAGLNPTETVMAIAERTADYIIHEYS